jgi:hypothetical protein
MGIRYIYQEGAKAIAEREGKAPQQVLREAADKTVEFSPEGEADIEAALMREVADTLDSEP